MFDGLSDLFGANWCGIDGVDVSFKNYPVFLRGYLVVIRFAPDCALVEFRVDEGQIEAGELIIPVYQGVEAND